MLNYAVLPNLFALAALVVVFRSMLRRRVGDQLDSWLRGWIFVLLYFAARLFDVGHGPWQRSIHTVALLLLELSGVSFIRAASRLALHASRRFYLTVWVVGVLAYTALVGMEIHASWAYWIAVAVMTTGNTARNFKVKNYRTMGDNLFSVLFAWLLSLVLSALILLHHVEYGVDATLTWLFLMSGICYAQRFPRRTTGVMTAVGGFFAWALVHPLGLLAARYAPGVSLQDVFWGTPKYVTAIGILLTFLEVHIDRAEHLALHDPLTGLPNRRLFEDRLERALERAQRNQTRVAVFLIDLDGFKQINDTYGHAVGDAVLCAVASRLHARIRKSDTIARTGGDEFTILISDLQHAFGAEVLARNLQEEMQQSLTIARRVGELQLRVGGSVGMALYPDHAQKADELCALADAAMYRIKRSMKSLHTRMEDPDGESESDEDFESEGAM